MDVREEVRLIAQTLAEEEGYEVIDVEQSTLGKHRILRVYLDRQGGVNIDDCSKFSRRLGDRLDMNQTVPGSYHLEVSSPGLERPLRTLEHVTRFTGQRVALQTHDPHDGRRKFEGLLMGPDGSRVGVRLDEGPEHWFEWAEVKSARLVVDPWEGLRNPKSRKTADGRPRGGAR